MVNEEIAGTDIHKDWILDTEGDLQLVHGSDNLSQAIFLRLTAYMDSLKWAYTDYGSTTKDWLGKNQNIYNRQTLLDEIRKRILHDPRIYRAEVELLDWTSHGIGIKIIAHLMDGETYQDYFIFSDLPRRNENINSPEYSNTWIDTRETGYFAKQGQEVTVHCYVRDKWNKPVPIGEVGISIGGYRVEIDNNPQEISQSGSPEPGRCTFKFRVPKFIKVGLHKLIFTYKGIRGYNNCVGETDFHVVESLPTDMEFKYRRKDVPYYYANDWDLFTEPVVHVQDINDQDVLHGEVRYYLSETDREEDIITLEFPIIFHGDCLIQRNVIMRVHATVLDYSTNLVFRVRYMFRPGEIFELVSQNGDHIDYLEVLHENDTFYLLTTTITRPLTHHSEDRDKDIQTMRLPNASYRMEVVE